MTLPPFLHRSREGSILQIYVQPKAARNELAGIHQESLKIRLTAPPVEGEANRECIRFLAKLLNVSRSSIEILQGLKSRHKTLLIRDLTPESLQTLLQQIGVP